MFKYISGYFSVTMYRCCSLNVSIISFTHGTTLVWPVLPPHDKHDLVLGLVTNSQQPRGEADNQQVHNSIDRHREIINAKGKNTIL